MSDAHYVVVEDSQIEITEAEMESLTPIPLPPNSLWFTTAEAERTTWNPNAPVS